MVEVQETGPITIYHGQSSLSAIGRHRRGRCFSAGHLQGKQAVATKLCGAVQSIAQGCGGQEMQDSTQLSPSCVTSGLDPSNASVKSLDQLRIWPGTHVICHCPVLDASSGEC